MTMQNEHSGHGLSDSLTAQLGLMVVALIVVLAIAWVYVF